MGDFLEGLLKIEARGRAVGEGVALGVPGGGLSAVALAAGALVGSLDILGHIHCEIFIEPAFSTVFDVFMAGAVA